MPRPLRSFLFAPGNRPRMLEKVGHCGADAVILDLEDAVPISEKEATRAAGARRGRRHRYLPGVRAHQPVGGGGRIFAAHR